VIDWNNATGMQLEVVHDALLHAFPTPEDFSTFLFLQLGRNYAALSGNKTKYSNGLVEVLQDAQSNGWLNDLIDAALKSKPQNPRLKVLRYLGDLTSAAPPAGRTLEDIVRKDGGFQNVLVWIRRLNEEVRKVCRIEYPINQGVGTGWLVANDLVLTNGHVAAPIIAGARKATDYHCRFDYATDTSGTNPGVSISLAEKAVLSSSPASPLELGTGTAAPTLGELDYALLRLSQNAGDTMSPLGSKRGWLATSRGRPIPSDGSILVVLQHPSGDPLKMDIGFVLGRNADGSRVTHNVTTVSGSSGSPCLNIKMELAALHNAGDPMYDGITGSAKENRAVPIEPILAKLDGEPVPKFWL